MRKSNNGRAHAIGDVSQVIRRCTPLILLGMALLIPSTAWSQVCVGDSPNGILEETELCDDGNALSGDGCDANCQVESRFECKAVTFGGYFGEFADGPSPSPLWSTEPSNRIVSQSTNSDPTVFMTSLDAQDTEVVIRANVNTTGDDDFFGLTIGYMPGDFTNVDANYLILSWKKNDQTTGGYGTALRGMNLMHIQGEVTEPQLWERLAGGPILSVTEAATLANAAWTHQVDYSFRIQYSDDRLEIWVSDGTTETKEFDLAPADLGVDAFPTSSIGVYAHSQPNTVFEILTPFADSVCVLLPDSDEDGVPDFVEDPNGNGIVDEGETDPNSADSDGDGLSDGWVDQNGDGIAQPNEGEDLNGDGIVNDGETDPLNADSDNGGENDGSEVESGRDPLDPGDDVDPNAPQDVVDSQVDAGNSADEATEDDLGSNSNGGNIGAGLAASGGGCSASSQPQDIGLGLLMLLLVLGRMRKRA